MNAIPYTSYQCGCLPVRLVACILIITGHAVKGEKEKLEAGTDSNTYLLRAIHHVAIPTVDQDSGSIGPAS